MSENAHLEGAREHALLLALVDRTVPVAREAQVPSASSLTRRPVLPRARVRTAPSTFSALRPGGQPRAMPKGLAYFPVELKPGKDGSPLREARSGGDPRCDLKRTTAAIAHATMGLAWSSSRLAARRPRAAPPPPPPAPPPPPPRRSRAPRRLRRHDAAAAAEAVARRAHPGALKGIGEAFNAHDAQDDRVVLHGGRASTDATASRALTGATTSTKAMEGLFATFSDAKSAPTRVWIKGNVVVAEIGLDRDDDGRLHGHEGHEEAGRGSSASTSCGSTTTASSRRCTSTATTPG